jgi:hypothetical protein
MNTNAKKKTRVLSLLTSLSDNLHSSAIDALKKEAIDDLVEVAKNVIHGTFYLTPQELVDLRRFKEDLRILTLKSTSLTRRKNILKNRGLVKSIAKSVFK